MKAKNIKDVNPLIFKEESNENEYYMDLTPDQKTELKVAQRQKANGGYTTMYDLDKKVKLWLNEK